MEKPEISTTPANDAGMVTARRAFLKRAGMTGVAAAGATVVLATGSKPALAFGRRGGKGRRGKAGPSYRG